MSKSKKADPNGKISAEALAFVRALQNPEVQSETGEIITADWRTVDSSLILGALYAYTAAGGAVLYGVSRDGFLFSVTVYAGGEKGTKWFHCVRQFDELHDYLRMIIETFEGSQTS
jgi:hypothetical protein